MRIALVDSTPKPKVYPLALLKLGAWRRAQGDSCMLFNDRLPAAGVFDEIWITTCFTFDIPHALGLVREARKRAPVVRVGGISATLLPEYFEKEGAQVYRGLVPEAEAYGPDYSLLPGAPDYSITHTSRGCVRKCGFCMVTRLEPQFENRPGWEADLYPGASHVLFYDNNWLAKPKEQLFADIEQIRALVAAGRIRSFDFNQAIDCRLMTEEIADRLAGLPLDPVRFAFDGMQEDGYYQRAVAMLAARGFRVFRTYVLYNFMDKPADLYYRLRESVRLQIGLGVQVRSFPMRYQPILEPDTGRQYVGKHWTKTQKYALMSIINSHSMGIIAADSMAEFEYWFGASPEEFVRRLNFPGIKKLNARKSASLRYRRLTRQADIWGTGPMDVQNPMDEP